jgi:hypothetical protein
MQANYYSAETMVYDTATLKQLLEKGAIYEVERQ